MSDVTTEKCIESLEKAGEASYFVSHGVDRETTGVYRIRKAEDGAEHHEVFIASEQAWVEDETHFAERLKPIDIGGQKTSPLGAAVIMRIEISREEEHRTLDDGMKSSTGI